MSKKTFFILLILLGLGIAVMIGYYSVSQQSGTGVNKKSSIFGLFPFGNRSGGAPVESTTTPIENIPELPPVQQNTVIAKLRLLSESPVSGVGILNTKKGPIAQYMEVLTGRIYQTELFSENKDILSDAKIPYSYDSLWGNKNYSLIARYLKDDNKTIDTYSLTLKNLSTTTKNTVSAVAFPANISDISVSPNTVFYLIQNRDSSAGFISNWTGGERKQIWDSPIKDLLSQFVNESTIALTTKPEPGIVGYLYFISIKTGQIRKILGSVAGLSTLVDPDGNRVLYIAQSGAISMTIYDEAKKTSQILSPATLPEKCVWGKKDKNVLYCAVPRVYLNGSSQNQWYKGLTSFEDDIWKYDIKNTTASLVTGMEESAIDIIKPILSENEQFIVFIDKQNGSLWSLDLSK